MIDQQLVGSVLMFGFRGGSLDDPETRQDIDELKIIMPRGVILFDHDLVANAPRNIRSPKQLSKLIEDIRNELGQDLVIAIDQEGGSVARLNEKNGFLPTLRADEFCALSETDQHQYAETQARQLSKLGINLNFAPCVDLAIEPDSPIIAGKGRSFGRTIDQVRACAHRVIDAHHRAGVGCCIKHFPGHGSSTLDSHLGVCDITKAHTHDELEIFHRLIAHYKNSIAVMSGHLINKKIDETYPASLSTKYTTGVLRDDIGFEGVVITDSLDMRAIRSQFGEGESAALAINAGADLVLDGMNAPGFREPCAAARIALGVRGSVPQARLIEASARLDRFFAR